MIFNYKVCNDATVQEALMKACDDSYGLAYGARYILKSGKLIIAFYSDVNDITKERQFDNMRKALEEKLPYTYKTNYEVWNMERFYRNVPSIMYKRTGKFNRRETNI